MKLVRIASFLLEKINLGLLYSKKSSVFKEHLMVNAELGMVAHICKPST